MHLKISILLMLFSFTYVWPVHAYIGPGLSAGTIGAVLGIIGSVFIALFALFWYPIKRIMKNIKNKFSGKSQKPAGE